MLEERRAVFALSPDYLSIVLSGKMLCLISGAQQEMTRMASKLADKLGLDQLMVLADGLSYGGLEVEDGLLTSCNGTGNR